MAEVTRAHSLLAMTLFASSFPGVAVVLVVTVSTSVGATVGVGVVVVGMVGIVLVSALELVDLFVSAG